MAIHLYQIVSATKQVNIQGQVKYNFICIKCSIGIKLYFYGDAGTGPYISNLIQDSLVKSAQPSNTFQNEVIVHFLLSFTIQISTSIFITIL